MKRRTSEQIDMDTRADATADEQEILGRATTDFLLTQEYPPEAEDVMTQEDFYEVLKKVSQPRVFRRDARNSET